MNTATLPGPSPSRRSFSRWWDQMSIYLPVLLMMLLALASYWLLRATPIPEEPGPKPEVTHEPDYFMQRFSVKVFEPSGTLKTELYGTAARHHPDVGTLVVDAARVRLWLPGWGSYKWSMPSSSTPPPCWTSTTSAWTSRPTDSSAVYVGCLSAPHLSSSMLT